MRKTRWTPAAAAAASASASAVATAVRRRRQRWKGACENRDDKGFWVGTIGGLWGSCKTVNDQSPLAIVSIPKSQETVRNRWQLEDCWSLRLNSSAETFISVIKVQVRFFLMLVFTMSSCLFVFILYFSLFISHSPPLCSSQYTLSSTLLIVFFFFFFVKFWVEIM